MEGNLTNGIVERIKFLYDSAQWHDLEFHLVDGDTGDIVILRAHRLILAPCSPVFEALCYGPMAEKGPILVTDVDPKGFEAMLQYLYTDSLPLKSVDMVSSLLYAAKKYLISSLCDLAEKFLIENISDSNCVDLFHLGSLLDYTRLEEKSYEHLSRRLNFVAKYITSDNVSTALLNKLVTSNVLNCDEMSLVQLSEMWAVRTCEEMNLEISPMNVRNLLLQYNIFQNIRWKVLTDDDMDQVMPGLLTDEEKAKLVDCGLSAPRVGCPFKYACVHRYVVNTKFRKDIPQHTPIITIVKVNKSVKLRGLFIQAKSNPMSVISQRLQTYKERMELKIMDGSSVLLEDSLSQEVEYGTPFLWTLKMTLPLIENTVYDMSIRLSSSIEAYPFGEMSNESKIPSGLVVHCSQLIDSNGHLRDARDLSIISGFQFLY